MRRRLSDVEFDKLFRYLWWQSKKTEDEEASIKANRRTKKRHD